MSLENISTFEHDVAAELAAKEATVRSIAAASGDVGNTDKKDQSESKKSASKKPLLIVGAVTLVVSLIGGIGYLYTINRDTQVVPLVVAPEKSKEQVKEESLQKLTPLFGDSIGQFITTVKKNPNSYVITISEFKPVFSYLERNRSEYIEEIATVLGVEHEYRDAPTYEELAKLSALPPKATTTTKAGVPTPQKNQKVATTTPKAPVPVTATTSSSTLIMEDIELTVPQTVPEPVAPKAPQIQVPFTYSDITISNQNIRVVTSGANSFYYAYIDTKAVVFATTVEEIFAQKSAILR